MPDKRATREGEEVEDESTEAVDALGWEQMNKADYDLVAAGEKPSFQQEPEEEAAPVADEE